jgi:hypothetical protein
MKSKMLIVAALASLLASAGMAGAQGSNEGGRNAQHAQSPSERAQPNNRMGQSERGPSNNRVGQSEPKNSGKTDRLDTQKSGTTNPSSQNERNRTNPSAQNERNKTERNPSATENERGRNERNVAAENRENLNQRSGAAENRDRTEQNRTTAERPASGTLSSEQRTKIRTTVLGERNAPRIARSDINVTLSVGTRIPRDRLHIRPLPLPETVVEVEPQWRGYDYFLVGDEIIVVDPDSLEIVAVLPA